MVEKKDEEEEEENRKKKGFAPPAAYTQSNAKQKKVDKTMGRVKWGSKPKNETKEEREKRILAKPGLSHEEKAKKFNAIREIGKKAHHIWKKDMKIRHANAAPKRVNDLLPKINSDAASGFGNKGGGLKRSVVGSTISTSTLTKSIVPSTKINNKSSSGSKIAGPTKPNTTKPASVAGSKYAPSLVGIFN